MMKTQSAPLEGAIREMIKADPGVSIVADAGGFYDKYANGDCFPRNKYFGKVAFLTKDRSGPPMIAIIESATPLDRRGSKICAALNEFLSANNSNYEVDIMGVRKLDRPSDMTFLKKTDDKRFLSVHED